MNNIQISQAIRIQKERLNRLKVQRNSVDKTSRKSENVLKEMLEILDKEYADFMQKHEEIIASVKSEDYEDYDYFTDDIQENFEEVYLILFAEIQGMCDELSTEDVQELQQSHPTNSEVFQLLESIQKKSHAKLPPLNLTHFTGKYIKWNAFHDQFCAAVHDIPSIPAVQKMQHLLTFVDEPAKSIIKHLPIVENSYLPAWELLKKRYGNKRAIFMNAMSQLLSVQRSQKESVSMLQNLSTILHETIQSLKNVNVSIENVDPIVAYLVIEKLPPETRKEFEKDAVLNQNLPSVKDVDDRIQNSLRTLELLESTKAEKTNESQQSKQSKEKVNHNSIKSFHFSKGKNEAISRPSTRDSSLSSNRENEVKYTSCSKKHSISVCPNFLAMSIYERANRVKSWNLCFNCLSANHFRTQCTSKMNCKECGRRHHSLLHQPQASTSTANSDSVAIDSQQQDKTISKVVHTATLSEEFPLFRSTLLSTAIVTATTKNGTQISLRALLDMGGEASAITESCVQLLKLNKHKCSINFTHLDDAVSRSRSHVTFQIQSCISS